MREMEEKEKGGMGKEIMPPYQILEYTTNYKLCFTEKLGNTNEITVCFVKDSWASCSLNYSGSSFRKQTTGIFEARYLPYCAVLRIL